MQSTPCPPPPPHLLAWLGNPDLNKVILYVAITLHGILPSKFAHWLHDRKLHNCANIRLLIDKADSLADAYHTLVFMDPLP